MEAYVDPEVCIGCELCTTIEPEVFRMNDEGKSETYGRTTDANKENVKQAIESCPVDAISAK